MFNKRPDQQNINAAQACFNLICKHKQNLLKNLKNAEKWINTLSVKIEVQKLRRQLEKDLNTLEARKTLFDIESKYL